jgi:hypothetical protein
MNGDLSVVEANNLLRTVTEATNNNTKALGEVIKRIGQLSDAVLTTRNESIELANVLREFLRVDGITHSNSRKRQDDRRYVSYPYC